MESPRDFTQRAQPPRVDCTMQMMLTSNRPFRIQMRGVMIRFLKTQFHVVPKKIVTLRFKGLVHPTLKFYPFNAYLILWRQFLIPINVLKFHRGKESSTLSTLSTLNGSLLWPCSQREKNLNGLNTIYYYYKQYYYYYYLPYSRGLT